MTLGQSINTVRIPKQVKRQKKDSQTDAYRIPQDAGVFHAFPSWLLFPMGGWKKRATLITQRRKLQRRYGDRDIELSEGTCKERAGGLYTSFNEHH